MTDDKDYYAILGVVPTSEAALIKAAYRRLSKLYHPDVYHGHDAKQKMSDLNEAYDVLSDVGKRKRYDDTRGDRSHRGAEFSSASSTAESRADPLEERWIAELLAKIKKHALTLLDRSLGWIAGLLAKTKKNARFLLGIPLGVVLLLGIAVLVPKGLEKAKEKAVAEMAIAEKAAAEAAAEAEMAVKKAAAEKVVAEKVAAKKAAEMATPKVVGPVKPVRPVDPDRMGPKPDSDPVVDPVETSLTKGLVVYWDFNRTSWGGRMHQVEGRYGKRASRLGVIDVSGKGLDAVMGGQRITTIFGVGGRAIQFRGTSYVKVEDTSQPVLPYDQPWSVAMWYKWASGGGILFAKVADDQKPGYYARVTDRGIFEWRHMHEYKEKQIKIVAKTDMRSLPSEQGWRHIILQYDGAMKAKGIVLYIDGKEQEYAILHDGLKGPAVNNVPFFLGRNAKGDSPLHGDLDEFRIYNRTLEEAEIRRLADATRVAQRWQDVLDALDEKIIAITREDFALIKQGFLAPDFDLSGAIQSLQRMKNFVVSRSPSLAADIQRVIKELNAQVEQGVADVMRSLEARAALLVNAGNYGEAADLYDAYAGAFKAETIALRHARMKALGEQTTATREIPPHLIHRLRENFVEDLLDQRFDAVFEARSDVELEYPALAATPAFKELASDVDQLREARDLILASFKPGETVSLELRNGQKGSVKVLAIKEDAIMVQPLAKGVDGNKPIKLRVSMLSPSEQFNRLGKAKTPAAAFYKGILLIASKDPMKASPFLKEANAKLATTIASRLTEVLHERKDKAMHAYMLKFRSQLGVPEDLTDPAKIRERIFARSISGVALKSHRNKALEARKRYGKSPAFKQHESFIKVLESMRVPEDIRPSVGALGVMSMASNRIKRIGEKKWGMLSEGLKRSVGVISGSPQMNASEVGKLFTFTGSNHISFKDGLGIKENSDWTVTFWANPEPGQADGSMIVLGVWGRDNTSCLMGIKGSKFHLAAPNKQKTGGVVKPNTWQHHVITHQGPRTTLMKVSRGTGLTVTRSRITGPRTTWLVDGKAIISLDQSLSLNKYLILGGRRDSAGAVRYLFKGQLKDIHIYNRALDPHEINQLNAAVRSTL
jgi:hypothetical protein